MMSHQPNSEMLASCIKEILSFAKPTEEDRLKRQRTIDELGTLLQSVESFRYATIKPFGSYISNLYTMSSDLDIAIEISNNPKTMITQDRKRYFLRQLLNALRRTGIGCNFKYIPLARVPLLTYESSQQKIKCDISMDNHFVQIKSKFLLWISEMETRFRDLVLLVKLWAKAHNINDAKSGTLNSYSLCLLVIFHLQTCQPAILPPLREIYGGNISGDIEGMGLAAECHIKQTSDAAIASFRTRNQDSVAELLISFFEKFSDIQNKSSQYAICTFTGRWERTYLKSEWMGKSYHLIIEDPFSLGENAARAVGAGELITIADAFSETHRKLTSRRYLSNRWPLLDCLVGLSIRVQLDARETRRPSYNNVTTNQNIVTVGTSATNIYASVVHRSESNYNARQRSRMTIPGVGATNVNSMIHNRFQRGLTLDDDRQPSTSTTNRRVPPYAQQSISRPDSGTNHFRR